MKKIYVVRHCEATGQAPEAELTEKGIQQSKQLLDFFANTKINRILSSPYERAVKTIQPLAERLQLPIEMESRLAERVLSTDNLPDWFEKLRETFVDLDLAFEGGESSREAMNRIVEVVEELFNSDTEDVVIVTHGNIMSLLLMYVDDQFGFQEWQDLRNPDVYLVTKQSAKKTWECLWN